MVFFMFVSADLGFILWHWNKQEWLSTYKAEHDLSLIKMKKKEKKKIDE